MMLIEYCAIALHQALACSMTATGTGTANYMELTVFGILNTHSSACILSYGSWGALPLDIKWHQYQYRSINHDEQS